ncbi:hypothetical protein TNCV_801231 [Trichonephila clavipes]|nr:hypothetical protein TNCV_801231 [Trichonephila clavipes]
MARVLQGHPGNDGLVRVATVKTQDSVLKRPVHKLHKLPITSSDIGWERSRQLPMGPIRACSVSAPKAGYRASRIPLPRCLHVV